MKNIQYLRRSAWSWSIIYLLWACNAPLTPKSPTEANETSADMSVENTGQTATAGTSSVDQMPTMTDPTTPVCQPQCEGKSCGDDQCGGQCGTCTTGQVCQVDQCVMEETCASSCESEQAQCGMVCGTSCGECTGQDTCQQGQCVCQPDCRNKSCGDDNGCGGVCAPCPRPQSCDQCILQLRVIEQQSNQGRVHTVRVELSVHLDEASPHPQMADIRLAVKGPTTLSRVGMSDALIQTQKNLVPDARTGLAYRYQPADEAYPADIYAFTILSTQNTESIPTGSWLVFDFQVGDTRAEPIEISLIKREQIFAPIQADSLLWGDEFEQSIVIWPTLNLGEAP